MTKVFDEIFNVKAPGLELPIERCCIDEYSEPKCSSIAGLSRKNYSKNFCQAVLVGLLKKKMALGIGDRDPLIRANVGFLEGCAIQIDLGPLYQDPSLKYLDKQKKELDKATLSLRHWLEAHHPSMLSFLDHALEDL